MECIAPHRFQYTNKMLWASPFLASMGGHQRRNMSPVAPPPLAIFSPLTSQGKPKRARLGDHPEGEQRNHVGRKANVARSRSASLFRD
eukprot:scaffold161829_cov32-Tisochrysis_lutea.AAC.2